MGNLEEWMVTSETQMVVEVGEVLDNVTNWKS